MIRFLSAGRRAGGAWAPARATFAVESGECVRLVGPPGAGASTLIAMALGETAPHAGSVMINGVNPFRSTVGTRQGLRRLLGAVLDAEPVLAVSAESWVAAGAWTAGTPWPTAVAAAKTALERFGLAALGPDPLASAGRNQRLVLSFARALLRRPHAILVDWRDAGAEEVPEALREDLAAFVAGGGALLMTGTPADVDWLPPARLERLPPAGPMTTEDGGMGGEPE